MANNVMITNYEMNFRDMKALAVYLEGKCWKRICSILEHYTSAQN